MLNKKLKKALQTDNTVIALEIQARKEDIAQWKISMDDLFVKSD
jgi:hypothetical protein